MLFLKGPRGLVFIFVVLIFLTIYYCYLRLEVLPGLHKSEFIIPQDVRVEPEWLADGKRKPTKPVEEAVNPSKTPHIQPSSTPTYKPDLEAEHVSVVPSSELSVSPSDILLIVKTGASTAWRRMPVQLLTTLSTLSNTVIYSDLQENLSHEIQTVDILSNVSDILHIHDTTAYGIYQDLQTNAHAYREQAQLPGDEPELPPGNKPGWILDRYKFIPMLEHAQNNYPGFKWTVYIEDDTFVFWTNLLRWLATLSADDEPSYYGAYSGQDNATFAQGGSGIVFSRSLMTSVFSGPKVPTLQEYANFTANACCGDMVLGKVLHDHNVLVNRGEYGPVSFRPEPPWRTGFEEFSWCKPIFTLHHLHQRDLVQLAMLERKHNESNLGSRPIIFRDIFLATISSYLKDRRDDWDNFASRHKLTENITTITNPLWGPPAPVVQDTVALEQAYTSPEACFAACVALSTCRIWRHEIDNEKQKSCSLDTVVILGREIEGRPLWDKSIVNSGWMMERISGSLMNDECEVVILP
ncbi:glycosyltransferase family 31 protein [Sclerotinia borealis F-4128]|uniref:Glycosyltransferase family 31 protein n=1 Tax=Sclerotinia borealis (strain F-4128) TaxID=1432307 RepID=W9C5Y0_SCLBF|nr:glycosyltransferase family 31 protein [Sclerotinia borealis F-4128]